MYEIINEILIKIKEYKGYRVVTLKDIDMVHNRPEGTARRNFNANKEHLIEGEDFFIINQPDEIRTLGLERPQGGTPSSIILLTESGYLMLVKSFTDELAWDVQRKLVNTYFRVQTIDVSYNELLKMCNDIISRMDAMETKIDRLEKKSEKIASDTCVTLRPAFIQLHEKINNTDKRMEKFSANFASEISGRLRPYFRSLDNKIKSFTKSSDRKSESISKAVGDNTKLMSAYLDTLADILKK